MSTLARPLRWPPIFPLEKGLVLWLPFNERSGSKALDRSGKLNHGTLHGPTWVAGRRGSALSFDGVDDYVGIPYFGESRTELTVELWFMMKEIADDWNSLIGRAEEHNYGWRLYQNKNKSIVVFTYQGVDGEIRWLLSSPQLDLNVWYLLAVTFSVSEKKAYLYLNGVPVKSSTNVVEIGNGIEDMCIGGYFTSSSFKGVIDEVRIYNRALTAAEIKRHYESEMIQARA